MAMTESKATQEFIEKSELGVLSVEGFQSRENLSSQGRKVRICNTSLWSQLLSGTTLCVIAIQGDSAQPP